MTRVAVVGAGLGGLTAGYRLQQAGCEVEVFEAADVAGGRVQTRRAEGYAMDTGRRRLARRITAISHSPRNSGSKSSVPQRMSASDATAQPTCST